MFTTPLAPCGSSRLASFVPLPKTINKALTSKGEAAACGASPWRAIIPQIAATGFLSQVGSALALTYDVDIPTISPEDMQAATETAATVAPAEGLASLQDNPILIAGIVAFLLVGAAFAAASTSGKLKPTVRGASPDAILGILTEDPGAIFVDIRSTTDVKKSGSPSLSGIKGKAKVLPYTIVKGDEVTVSKAFGEKFAKLSGLRDESVVVLFDSDGTFSPKAAEEILKVLEFKYVLYVRGGEKMWRSSDLGWKEPPKPVKIPTVQIPQIPLPNVDFKGAVKGVSGAVQGVGGAVRGAASSVGSTNVPLGPGLLVGAFAAASFIIINEIDLILEIVGLVGAINIIGSKLIFAESRSEVVDRIRSLVKDEIAPQEAGDDLKRLAAAVMSFPKDIRTADAQAKASKASE